MLEHIEAVALKRHIERHAKKVYALSPMQVHLICAIYSLNVRQISPTLSEIGKYIGENNVNNCYASIGLLERKSLVCSVLDGTIRVKGQIPKRYSILPKGKECINELNTVIVSYSNMKFTTI